MLYLCSPTTVLRPSFGHADATAWLADVALAELMALLEPTGL